MHVLTNEELLEISRRTITHYEKGAEGFWEGTRNHDVAQNIDALVGALDQSSGQRILDFGCGPGRDLLELQRRGHQAVGLDGCPAFVRQARALSGAEVLQQDFLNLDLPKDAFDGIFANASLFHVPTQELPRVLAELRVSLRAGGVLFTSNPRGTNQEGYRGERYGAFHSDVTWLSQLEKSGFEHLHHYFRPTGLPREQQPWLATLWRRPCLLRPY